MTAHKNPLKDISILIICLIAFVIIWILHPQNCAPSDPFAYSSRAFALAENGFLDNVLTFDYRIGLTAPVALFYKLFGISLYSTNLWPMLTVLGLIVGVWLVLPNSKTKAIGAGVCVLSAPLYQWSSTLFPDIVAAMFMFFASYLLWRRDDTLHHRFWILFPLLSMTLLFCGFLTKMTAYWVIPLWILQLGFDIHHRRWDLLRRFHFAAFLCGLVLLIGYCIFSYYIYGHPIARFLVIQSLHEDHLWSWSRVPLEALIRRVTISPIKLFTLEYGLLFPIAIISIFAVARNMRFWWYYTMILIGLYWFGSTNFSYYNPLPISKRDIISTLPGLVILSALMIDKVAQKTCLWKYQIKVLFFAAISLSVLLLFSYYLFQWQKMRPIEPQAMTAFKKVINDPSKRSSLLICADKRNPTYLPFYFAFKNPDNLTIKYAANVTEQDIKNKDIYVYHNKILSSFLTSRYDYRDYGQVLSTLENQVIFHTPHISITQIQNTDKLWPLLNSER
ncbi:MAG: hypothetical protein HQL32_02210 [Planctomycetes bacterium]|nr:hypothetical protein [Planctomycetota bacterium]